MLINTARIDEAATHVNIAREHVLIDQHLRTSSPPTRDVDMSCSRKHLLLSHEQMLADNFPSPTGTGESNFARLVTYRWMVCNKGRVKQAESAIFQVCRYIYYSKIALNI